MAKKQHPISRDAANKEIRRYLKMQEAILKSKYFDRLPKEVKTFIGSRRISFAFYKEEVLDLFAKVPGANGLRIYMALNRSKSRTAVMTPCQITLGSVIIQNKLPAPPDDGGNQYPFVVPTKQDGDSFDLGDE